MPRGKELHHRQATAEPVPVLPVPEMPRDGHEKGGRAGGATADQGERHLRSGIDVQSAHGHVHRADTRGREESRLQKRTTRRVRGTYS